MSGTRRQQSPNADRNERRLFIALPFRNPSPALDRISEDLRGFGSSLNVVRTENHHLTLKFIGNTPAGLYNDLLRAFNGLTVSRRPLPFRLVGLGAFPTLHAPTVLWCGLCFRDDRHLDLFQAIESMTAGLGFPQETRIFKPHLTLARRKRGADPSHELTAYIADRRDHDYGDGVFSELVLYESTLLPAGPLYTPRASIALDLPYAPTGGQ